MSNRIYAIGDIHGQLEKLKRVHDLIDADRDRTGGADATVVHVGDLVDRGPDSAGVLDYLINGRAEGRSWVVLKGNHDRMFTGFLDNPMAQDPGLRADLPWLDPRLGGAATLASYGVDVASARDTGAIHADAVAAVPDAHRGFLDALPVLYRAGGAAFVHAGIRPGVSFKEQSEDDLVWIRAPFLNDTRDHGALVVHGHTPVGQPTHYGNRVNIDTGAGYGDALSAVILEGRDVWHLTAGGRIRLRPDG